VLGLSGSRCCLDVDMSFCWVDGAPCSPVTEVPVPCKLDARGDAVDATWVGCAGFGLMWVLSLLGLMMFVYTLAVSLLTVLVLAVFVSMLNSCRSCFVSSW
jgi:hypothetical protein